MTPEELDHLTNLLASPGWLLLMAHAKQTYRDGFPGMVKTAIDMARRNRENVETAVLVAQGRADGVDEILSWPTQRISQLRQPARSASLSRGGM